ncbi:MAG: serine protease, partial [Candidatus Sulfotelmatobacter sp.]
AQVAPPKHESRWHHIFSRHREPENLEQRFNDIKCALVLIQSGPRLGTGFYISPDGDIATASHVLGDRMFSKNPDRTIKITFAMPALLGITNSKGERAQVASNHVENNPDAWLADVARIKTGVPAACWLQEVDDKESRPGQHLITIGFPGLSFQTLTIYTGIMSARLTTNLPTVILDTGEAVPPSNEFIRVQMPISTGLSGAPIIDDENRAIAAVTNAGGWSQDLDHLLFAFRGGAFQEPPPPPDPNQPPNTIKFTLNSMAVTAELAGLFHDYASPGYGDAVPLRYLTKPQQQNPPSASHDR